MKLWILKRVDMTFGDYDAYYGFVIRAESEEIAREMASKEERDRPGFWKNPALSICEELLPEGEGGILLDDFHAG